LLNYSLLFGFVDPAAYLTTGAWSIGNEMVFYALFPVILLLAQRSAFALPLIALVTVALAGYFASYALDETLLLSAQWSIYINPLNQLFLFVAGILIGAYGRDFEPGPRLRQVGIGLLVGSLLVFEFTPASGNLIRIVTDWNRLILSAASILIVAAVFLLKPKLWQTPSRLLGFLGQGCYSIYLLHPVVALPIVFAFARLGFENVAGYIVSIFATLVLSHYTFKYLEQPMMEAGKRVSARIKLT
jgi:peptidoglycan/LPS O-acetylase OafA/YrhL